MLTFYEGVANGAGFMFGLLLCYTVYDGLFTLAAKRVENRAKRKKRRR